MIGLHIDPDTNDVEIDAGGNLRMARDAEAVAQHVRQRLLSHEGEWFLDMGAGLPWFERVLGKAFEPALAEALVKAEIAETAGVTEVDGLSVQFDRRTRVMSLNGFSVATIYDGERNG